MSITRRTLIPIVSFASAALTGVHESSAGDAHQHSPSPGGKTGTDGAGKVPSTASREHHAGHAIPQNLTGDANYSKFIAEMNTGMEKMMEDMHSDPPSGDPDIDFLTMMIPHHWGATDMARLILKHGKDPLVREIAEKILASQVSEIEGMRGRLAELRSNSTTYPSLTGNRG